MKIYFPKMISLFAIATTLMLSACGGGGSDPKPDPEPEDDTTKPAIETTLPAATGQKYAMTNNFLYTGTFTDNVELAEVEFTLTNSKPAAAASLKVSAGVDDDPWTPDAFKVALTGKTQTLTNQVLFGGAIPNEVWTGEYTLTITCKDKAGNTQTASVKVEIE